MERLFFEQSKTTPHILLDPEANMFVFEGVSRPEDVREFYYPVVQWMNRFEMAIEDKKYSYTEAHPLLFKIDLSYFNSSSAKFLFDIFVKLKDLKEKAQHIEVLWMYDEEDTDLLEAGEEMAEIADMEFKFVEKK